MIDPSESQAQAFFASDQNSPVIFLNCHRYFPRARYPDDFNDHRYPINVSGHEAYHRYFSEVSGRFVPRVGGQIQLAGAVDMVFIGEGNWDEIIMSQYPSKAHAMRIPAMPGYEELAVHREAGLEFAQTLVLSPQEMMINILN
jgi:uncharacterized protein (DUF1330 family)